MNFEMIKSDHSSQICTIKCLQEDVHIVWVSDLHGDSGHSKVKFLEKVLKDYPDSLIIVGGDHLDVMQNAGDKRGSKSDLDERFKKDTYINEVIDYNTEFWGKYAKRILAFFVGNHEMTQVRFYGIDITREIVKNLNSQFGTNIVLGDLAGYLKVRFNNSGRKYVKNIYYAHRPISGGTRSKGMLSVDLIKGRYPDADIWITEHIHDTWIKPIRQERLTQDGKIYFQTKWVLQMPTLKDEFSGPKRGYTHGKNYEASPIGVVVLKFNISKRLRVEPKYELIEE